MPSASGPTMTISQRYVAYTDPLYLLRTFLTAFLKQAWHALLTLSIPTLFSLKALRERAFAAGFASERDGFREFESTTAIPGLMRAAHGVVLELGPGIGNQCDRYDASRITQIVGIEPNAAMVPALRNAADRAGLGGKYQILNCGVEDAETLKKAGIEKGSADCVVSIQVLCSVPEPEKAITELYELLKPGGEMIVFEHLECRDWLHRIMQAIYNPFWSFALDGCSLNRPTDRWLRAAGPWAKIQLERNEVEETLFPRVWGRLIKPSD